MKLDNKGWGYRMMALFIIVLIVFLIIAIYYIYRFYEEIGKRKMIDNSVVEVLKI